MCYPSVMSYSAVIAAESILVRRLGEIEAQIAEEERIILRANARICNLMEEGSSIRRIIDTMEF